VIRETIDIKITRFIRDDFNFLRIGKPSPLFLGKVLVNLPDYNGYGKIFLDGFPGPMGCSGYGVKSVCNPKIMLNNGGGRENQNRVT
jgi:hypothetical protein